jgi:hypothetical protein
MTDHPCKDMTPQQIAAFERIAINLPPECRRPTLAALAERGVIARRSDGSFYVPVHVHHQWCAWCAESGGHDD